MDEMGDDIERLVSPELKSETRERDAEGSLRPKWLKEYVGQEKVKEKLGLFIQAARLRNEALDHVLIAGPPGLGKTTLATIIANELGSHIHYVAGPNLDKKGDLAAILTNMEPNDVLFIDEIHRLQKTLEEILYGAMEDYRLDIVIGQGPAAKTLQLDLPKFTLVGATTRSGLLTSPLRDRFGVQLRLDFYPANELEQIVSRSAKLLGIEIEDLGAREIAKRSRGTPRIANRLLKRVRDFAQVKAAAGNTKGSGNLLPISANLADSALALLEVDHRGLDSLDRKYLLALINNFEGGAVGVESLASALGEERDTLEEICEPFLIQEGFIQRTSRGRVAMRQSYEHLGIAPRNLENQATPSV